MRPRGASSQDAVAIPEDGFDLEARLAAMEKAYLVAALEKTHGHLTNAARLLGITFRAIRYKIKKHGLKEPPEEGVL